MRSGRSNTRSAAQAQAAATTNNSRSALRSNKKVIFHYEIELTLIFYDRLRRIKNLLKMRRKRRSLRGSPSGTEVVLQSPSLPLPEASPRMIARVLANIITTMKPYIPRGHMLHSLILLILLINSR